MSAVRIVVLAGIVAAMVGCASRRDKPHGYGQQRPPVDQIDSRDRGLQSKDVVSATDAMAQELLGLPEVNASRVRWLVVVDRAENMTQTARFNMDIFLERLRVQLSRYGRDRIQLIENRDKLRELQSRELEGAGTPGSAPGPAGVQPDFALYARMMELPNRGTSYFMCQFTLTDLKTRQQVWSGMYEVKVDR